MRRPNPIFGIVFSVIIGSAMWVALFMVWIFF